MAAIYQRRDTWWIKFRHPVTGERVRQSLGTHEHARAELLRKRAEHEIALMRPEFQVARLPDSIYRILGTIVTGGPSTGTANAAPRDLMIATNDQMPSPKPAKPRVLLDDALTAYVKHIEQENGAKHIANKLSKLRKFIGADRVDKIAPQLRGRQVRGPRPKSYFTGTYLDEVTALVLQQFIDQLDVATLTKRRYRELFHHFFQFCIKYGLYEATNIHCPNPTSALPSYAVRNQRILYLSDQDIARQLEVLQPYPTFYAAVAVMIYAGLRRGELVWLRRDAFAKDLSYFSVVNRVDENDDEESSLKTGERAVTIIPELRRILELYLPTLESEWLIPRGDGSRYPGDAFGKDLKSVNVEACLPWNCLHYRHTYATSRAAEGWPLFRIASEMGNSVAIVEKHYAAYIRPAAFAESAAINGHSE